MYSIAAYGHMIADSVRVNAYTEALRRAVFPGAVVLDIGTGTGFLALLACRFGASRVYAIEPSDAIALAEQAAAANGYADRIQFYQQLSTEVSLEQKADVLVSDLRGVLPLFSKHISSIADARRRLLKAGAVIIPQRDVILMALAEAPERYRKRVAPWEPEVHGFDLAASRRVVVNEWEKAKFDRGELLSEPSIWATLDYETVEDPNVKNTLTLSAGRSGTAHGLAVWFEAEVMEGVGFSNAPGCPETVYSSAFFPFEEPLELAEGEKAEIHLRADLVGQDYVWTWKTAVAGRATFTQSTFMSGTYSAQAFRKTAASYCPKPTRRGSVDRFLLERLDGQRTNQELAECLRNEFPEQYPNSSEALNHVTDLVKRYGE